jgi:very-short-patch-repair endonuclease
MLPPHHPETMNYPEQNHWKTTPDLWEKLKPLARQMRKEPTPAEAALWQCLRGKKVLGFRFRRQHAIERFIVDFYCRKAKLIVEIDGPIHQYTIKEDAARQEFLVSKGLAILRFRNEEVLGDCDDVIERIEAVLRSYL